MRTLLLLIMLLPAVVRGQLVQTSPGGFVKTGMGGFVEGGGNAAVPPDGDPSALSATVVSDTRIDLSWTGGSTNETGTVIERSTDGTTYTKIDTVAPAATSVSVTGLTGGTRYYFRVREFKGSLYSDGSTDDDYTATKFALASTGTGAGVSTLRLNVSTTNVTATLDGNGKFYTDAGGTTGESTSWTITAGALRTIYLKVTSGTSNLLVFAKGNLIGFGSSSTDGWVSSTNAASISFNIAVLKNATVFNCVGSNTVTGDIAALPSVMTYFICYGSNTVTGDIAALPSVMTVFNCGGSNTVTGDIAALPSVMTVFNCGGSNRLNTYTSGRTWSNSINYIYLRQATGYGLSSTEVDNMLIDLASATWAGSGRAVDIRGVNAARTSASNAAVTTLTGKSVTVLTN